MPTTEPAAPPIGHNRPPESDEERATLIEQVAADLWESRDDRPWGEAGAYWHRAFRTFAAAAIDSVRRRDHR